MASLTDRAVLLADDARSKFSEEALEELTGESERNWALVAIAFVVGAVVAGILIVLRLRRIVETARVAAEAEPEPDPVATGEPQSWQRWAGSVRARLHSR